MIKVEQVGLKRGRYSQCKKFTSYACAACQACVCVLECLADSTKDSCFNINTATCTCDAMHA